MKSILKKIILLLILAAIAIAAYTVYKSGQDSGPPQGFATSNGRLEATEIDVAAKLAGRIREIRVDEGDFVKIGDLVAVMNTDGLEAQLGQAKAQVIQAKAAEANAQAQIAVKISDVNAAVATVGQKKSELEQTRRRLDRSSVLSEKGVITGQQFDDDETTEMAASAGVVTAQAQVDVARAAVTAAEAEAAGAVAQIKAAEAAVGAIAADIKDSYLVAPRNGRVQYRISQPGEVVTAGGKILNFVDLSDMFMNIYLPSADAGRVAIGDEARIVLDAYPSFPLPARVSYVAATAQFTPKTVETREEREKLTFRIKVRLDPQVVGGRLKFIKTGLPGVAWVRVDHGAPWPEELAIKDGVISKELVVDPDDETAAAERGRGSVPGRYAAPEWQGDPLNAPSSGSADEPAGQE